VLAYDYRAGSARLDDLPEVPISPHLYALCDRCATSLRPPRGWILDDRRAPTIDPVAPPDEAELVVEPVAFSPIDATPRLQPEPVSGIEPELVIETEPAARLQREPEAEPEEAGQRQLAFGYSA
jgi:hypothetical protein